MRRVSFQAIIKFEGTFFTYQSNTLCIFHFVIWTLNYNFLNSNQHAAWIVSRPVSQSHHHQRS